jgi:hypothetical protein
LDEIQRAIGTKEFGRIKTHLNEPDELLILEVDKEQKSDARQLEKLIEHGHGKHIPHNVIHQILLESGLAAEKENAKKTIYPI